MYIINIFKIVLLYENELRANQSANYWTTNRNEVSFITDIRRIGLLISVGAFSFSPMQSSSQYCLRKVHSADISVSGKNPLLIITFRPEVHESSSNGSLSQKAPRFLLQKMPSSNKKQF